MKEEAMFYQADEPDYNDTPYRPLHRKRPRPEQDWEQEPHDNLLL